MVRTIDDTLVKLLGWRVLAAVAVCRITCVIIAIILRRSNWTIPLSRAIGCVSSICGLSAICGVSICSISTIGAISWFGTIGRIVGNIKYWIVDHVNKCGCT